MRWKSWFVSFESAVLNKLTKTNFPFFRRIRTVDSEKAGVYRYIVTFDVAMTSTYNDLTIKSNILDPHNNFQPGGVHRDSGWAWPKHLRFCHWRACETNQGGNSKKWLRIQCTSDLPTLYHIDNCFHVCTPLPDKSVHRPIRRREYSKLIFHKLCIILPMTHSKKNITGQ